jgi:hypothetical protein
VDPWGQLETFESRTAWALACYKVVFEDAQAALVADDDSDDEEEQFDIMDWSLLLEELGDDTNPVMPPEDSKPTLFSFGWLFADELIYYGRTRDALGGVIEKSELMTAKGLPYHVRIF